VSQHEILHFMFQCHIWKYEKYSLLQIQIDQKTSFKILNIKLHMTFWHHHKWSPPRTHVKWWHLVVPEETEVKWAYLLLLKKLRGLSPRANYTDRATAACRRSDCPLLRIEGATWSAWRIPTSVFSVFERGAATFLSSSSSVVLTRLSGPHSRPTTFFCSARELNPGPLDL
jgi:hypothetical protein